MKKFLFILMLGLGSFGFITACEDKKDEADSGQQVEEPASDSGAPADTGDAPDAESSDAASGD